MHLGAYDDPAVLKRLASLPEDRILDYFWLMHRRGADPMWLLKQMGCLALDKPLDWDGAVVRREHVRAVKSGVIRLNRDRCFGCRQAGQLYHHHLIEIQNGGSNQIRNLVPLCFVCHKVLHPWLEEPIPTTGMVQVRHVMAPVLEALIESVEKQA
jgi:5-methylcytosine-specific restriction endonuclease McrA